MKILVTGADGLLGRSCMAQAKGRHDLAGRDIHDLDVADSSAVGEAFDSLRPDAVVHCAAYTNVDGAEKEPAQALEINAAGAERVARAAQEVGALMVYISTDYVFDGEKAAPYRELDATRPLSSYGVSKLEGERRVRETCPDSYLIVRTAWLYGPGSGFVDWVLRGLEEGPPLRLVIDHKGSPTYAMDLAEALFHLVEEGHRGVFHFVNKGETNWFGLGRATAELTGRPDAPLQAVSAGELGRAALRPAYSVLAVDKYEEATGKLVPSWQNALERYLAAAGRLG